MLSSIRGQHLWTRQCKTSLPSAPSTASEMTYFCFIQCTGLEKQPLILSYTILGPVNNSVKGCKE